MTEDIEKYTKYLDEVSDEKLGKYITKASEHKKEIVNDTSFKEPDAVSKFPKGAKQIANRSLGMVTARSKLGSKIHGYKKGPPKVMATKANVPATEEVIKETLSSDAPASEYIDDFVHSDNKRFKGKSKAERIRMALGASYGNKRSVKEELLKSVIEQNAIEPLMGEDGKKKSMISDKKKVKNQRFPKEIEK